MDAAILKLRAVRKGSETTLTGKYRVQIYERVLALTIVTIVVTRHRSNEKPWTIVRLWFIGPRARHGSVLSQKP